MSDVLTAWRTDPDFLGEDAAPAVLPMTGDGASFRTLIKRHAGDIPEGAMRKELERIDAVRVVDDSIHLVEPPADTKLKENRLATQLQSGPYPLLRAIAHNHMSDNPVDAWPFETVSETAIRHSDAARVQKIVSSRLHSATANIAELLEAYAALHADENDDDGRVAVTAGVFYTEGVELPE